MYGNEDSFGAALNASGISCEKLFITTKLTKIPKGKTDMDSLKKSLAQLKTDYVGLFFIHAPWNHDVLLAVWKEVEVIQKTGLARSIGVPNSGRRTSR
jgi:diketogulonate reductase-like aldo/keto reductase